MQVLQTLLAGALHAVAASVFNAATPWLQFIAIGWFAWVLSCTPTVKRAAFLGWLFAFVWYTGSFWWVYISMTRYGGMPAPMAVFALCALSGGLALLSGFAMGLARKASCVNTVFPLIFAAAWLLAELLRGWIFTGFPWASSGYTQVDGWMGAYAPWLGVYGVGFMMALFAASLVCAIQNIVNSKPHQAMIWTFVALAVFVLHWPMQKDFTESSGEMKVALLQGNIAQELKFTGQAKKEALDWYLEEMEKAVEQNTQLIVSPEIAIPYFVVKVDDTASGYLPESRFPDDAWYKLRTLFAQGDAAALIGVPLGNEITQKQTNAMIGLKPGTEVYQYDKYHLVPFGEFIPLGFRWFVNMMNIPLGDFDRGTVDAPSFDWSGQRIAPNICYEDLFGEELAQRFRNEANAPTIMVNASNIAWFGHTSALPQHLQISRMRSLELQRPMLRSTNTGMTAIINHRGAVEKQLEPYTTAVIYGTVEGRIGLTPYARWASRVGLLPLWIGSIGLIAFFLWRTRRGR